MTQNGPPSRVRALAIHRPEVLMSISGMGGSLNQTDKGLGRVEGSVTPLGARSVATEEAEMEGIEERICALESKVDELGAQARANTRLILELCVEAGVEGLTALRVLPGAQTPALPGSPPEQEVS